MNTIEKANQLAKEMCASGYRYLYGAKGQDYTTGLVNSLHNLYPSNVPLAEALKDADKGYKAIDCSGFVCKVLGIGSMGSYQLRKTAVQRFPVSRANARPGMAIWREGHIAYVGEGLNIYEAASTKSDMVVSKFEDRAFGFTELLIVKGSALENDIETGNPYPTPERTIKYVKDNIMTGDDVRWVQYNLVLCGYNIDVDGEFGPLSYSALVAFQRTHGLVIDGKCGPDTRACMVKTIGAKKENPYTEPVRVIKRTFPMMSGEDVKWVQWELNQAGFTLDIDGKFGKDSEATLKKFQESCKITVDGKCGPETRTYLKAN